MDDGGIVGSVELLQKAWKLLESEGPKIGLFLNPAKCEWSWLNPAKPDPCPIPGVELVPTDKITMLGVPLGSNEFVSKYVDQELVAAAKKFMKELSDFEDTQIGLYLLRISFGIVRAVHFMRTTPFNQWAKQAQQFDSEVRNTVESLIGRPLPPHAYRQACITTRYGGLGMRRVEDHATSAFSASWRECASNCGETWTLPPGCLPNVVSQKHASDDIDKAALECLISDSNTREAQRLRRLDSPHANAWLTALPSTTDGKDTVMTPLAFRVAVLRLLGLSVLPSPVPCPLCQQTIDLLGDHALCCRKTRDTSTRHNRMRNWVFQLAKWLVEPGDEKKDLLGDTPPGRRRPADVLIPLWRYGRGLAIDVAVICPVAQSHLDEKVPCESYGLFNKHDHYDEDFMNSQCDFLPMIFESSGGINDEGEKILKQLIRFASKRSRVLHSVYAGRAWARMQCVLQTAVAQMILNRIYEPDVSPPPV